MADDNLFETVILYSRDSQTSLVSKESNASLTEHVNSLNVGDQDCLNLSQESGKSSVNININCDNDGNGGGSEQKPEDKSPFSPPPTSPPEQPSGIFAHNFGSICLIFTIQLLPYSEF